MRSIRGGLAGTQAQVASRVVEQWSTSPDAALELHPAVAYLAGDVAITAGPTDGRWLLSAFMAGVRSMRPRDDATVDDVVVLAEELAHLDASVQSISRFHDWLWADGAEGFEVSLQPSFMEMMDEVVDDERLSRVRAVMLRGDALSAATADAMRMLALDLDAAAVHAELSAPLDAFTAAASRGALDSDDATLAGLHAHVEDPMGWVELEIRAVLASEALRAGVPPSRLARRILARVSTRMDGRFLGLLTAFHGEADPYRQALAAALETAEVGAAVGAKLRVDDVGARRALAGFLHGAAQPVATALVGRLLSRAEAEPAALDASAWLAESVGFARLRSWLDLPAVTPTAARTLVLVARRAHVDAPTIAETLAQMPTGAALYALDACAPGELVRFSTLLVTMLDAAEPSHVEHAARLIGASGAPDALGALGAWVQAHHKLGLAGRLLYAACGTLVSHGRGEDFVVPLVRAPFASDEVRTIALECLHDKPELLAQAVAFHPGFLLAGGDFRERLRAAKEKLERSR